MVECFYRSDSMKRSMSVLAVLFFLLATLGAEDGKPNMVIEQEMFDAGVVLRAGTPIEHAFRIKNTGTAELKILNVDPG
jgi:hypothetical protein